MIQHSHASPGKRGLLWRLAAVLLVIVTSESNAFTPADRNAIAALDLEIRGPQPNMLAAQNKITVGDVAPGDIPEMPDLTFSVILDRPGFPQLSQDVKDTIIYDWQFMVEYITGDLRESASAPYRTRRGLWTTVTYTDPSSSNVTTTEDGFLISAHTLPADPMPAPPIAYPQPANPSLPAWVNEDGSMRNWFAHVNDELHQSTGQWYSAENHADPNTARLHVVGQNEFHLRNDCSTITTGNCYQWGDKFGGGFFYAAVRIRIPDDQNPPNNAVDEWRTWGLGNCPNLPCPNPAIGAARVADYGAREKLLAIEPGVSISTASPATKRGTLLWRYIDVYVDALPDSSIRLIPGTADRTESRDLIKRMLKGASERETFVQNADGTNISNGASWMRDDGWITMSRDGGFGWGQLTNLDNRVGNTNVGGMPTYHEIWDFRKTTAAIFEILDAKLAAAISHLDPSWHSPAAHEVARGTLSRYNNGRPYFIEVSAMLDAAGNPREFELRDTNRPQTAGFPDIASTTMGQFSVTFGARDFYRKFVMCRHDDGARYSDPDTLNYLGHCTCGDTTRAEDEITLGYYREYVFNGTNTAFADTTPVCNTSRPRGTCYADRRAFASEPSDFAANDTTVTVPPLINAVTGPYCPCGVCP